MTQLSDAELGQYGFMLELRLRRQNGVAFQDFFASVMARRHGSDYVAIRPMGKTGDKGCDGYLQSTGCVYACYGKINDAGLNSNSVTDKMEEDYAKAAGQLADILQEWRFVHNMYDGMPITVPQKINTMSKANPSTKFGLFGPEAFWETINGMSRVDLDHLVGPVVVATDVRNLNIQEVADLINGVIDGMDRPVVDEAPIALPTNKIELNKITGHWKLQLETGMQNAKLVRDYVNAQASTRPLLGQTVANAVGAKYQDLSAQDLSPETILAHLFDAIAGKVQITPQRTTATIALLCYLFKACDIFESGAGTPT
ncbi:MAG: ABC-three component system protein [Pseudomonadota bacterium]